MPISVVLANRILDSVLRGTAWVAIPGIAISLHNGDPGTTGANEIVGGAYARVVGAAYSAAAGGSSALANPISYVNMPATDVTHVGIWSTDAAPVFMFGGILGGTPRPFTVDEAASNLLRSPGHGLAAAAVIRFIAPTTGALPGGLNTNARFYVIAAGLTADDFAVSATPGGAAVDITSVGNGSWYVDGSKTLNAGDTFTLNTDTVTLI